MLSDPRLFPVIILCLYALATLRYLFARDWAHAVYWTAAFALTWVVTFSLSKGQ